MNKWKLNNTILIMNRLLKKSKEKKKKTSLEINDNENMTTQNLWDTAKAVLRGKFITTQSYPRNKKNII